MNTLYRDGFIKLNTLTDDGVEVISEQLGVGEFTQTNNE